MYDQVFINYKGRDSHSYAALLYVELSRRFGPEWVFLDCESIPAGADYVAHLRYRIRAARVVLAVIGPDWLAGAGPRWRQRNKDTADWTRRELIEAFAAGVTVVPILTDHTDLPTERDLPASLAPLSRCQYRRLRHRDVTADLDRITHDLIAADPVLAYAAACHCATPASRLRAVQPSGPWPDLDRRPAAPEAIGSGWPAQPLAAVPFPDARAGQVAATPADRDPCFALYRTLVAGRKRCWP